MTHEQRDFSEFNPDFPELEVSTVEASSEREPTKRRRGTFKNVVRENDSLTTCPGFINQVRQVDGVYYVKAGLIAGSSPSGDGFRANIHNVELRVGPTLKKWAQTYGGLDRSCAGVRLSFVIRNLQYLARIKDGKPVLDTRGTIETITFGHLD